MRLFNFDNYTFVCEYWETSQAWGHKCTLMHGVECSSAKVRYYNRTWEAYTYQSVMQQALYNFKQSELTRYLRNKKCELGYITTDGYGNTIEKRWKSGEKKKYTEEFEQSAIGETIKKLEQHLRDGE